MNHINSWSLHNYNSPNFSSMCNINKVYVQPKSVPYQQHIHVYATI